MTKLQMIAAGLLLAAALAGCAQEAPAPRTTSPAPTTDGAPTGSLQQAGSSTVFPIAAEWARELQKRGIQVTVASGGSGAGASKLCAKEVDLGDLSREMKESEVSQCRANGVEPKAWRVAYDGLTVVVSKQNDFVDHLSVEELKSIWQDGSTVRTWADVRAGWPAEAIQLYGPDTDSGTYEYFNEVILGKGCGADQKSVCPSRDDYTPSPDDNILVEGVASSRYALGHFGFSYYEENADRLKAVPIRAAGAAAPVEPRFETIADGSYAPLSRPLYMYTDGVPPDGTALHAYLTYAFGEGQAIIQSVGYVALDEPTIASQRAEL